MKKFDLNIEKILENWEPYHAVRELIANALDEQILTKTDEIEIKKDGNSWIIRDYGRGLNYSHLTQNENQEKIKSTKVIGKFGIGLKDALATLDRNEIPIRIISSFGEIKLIKSNKEGFEDIKTLHALIDDLDTNSIIGTRVELIGIDDEEVKKAKRLFLKFSDEEIIESTSKGQIVKKGNGAANIYINGVKVAEEENFLFSYNITRLNSSIRKALNRERTNVGRSAYTETIKKLLLSSKSTEVAEQLGADLQNINIGDSHDEIQWIDVQEHAVKILNKEGKYLFITSLDSMKYPDMIDEATNNGYKVIVVTENLKRKIEGGTDLLGNPIVDLGQFISNYNDSFEFNFIQYEDLKNEEKRVYDLIPRIIKIYGGLPRKVKEIKISSKMRKDLFANKITLGCWDNQTKSIVIKRNLLQSIAKFSGTIVHELIHAKTGYDDVTREFESELTKNIGKIYQIVLENE